MLSPDGQQVVFVALQDLWLRKADGSVEQLTDDPFVQIMPSWSLDGKFIAYSSDKEGPFAIWVREMESEFDRKLLETGNSISGMSWSPDGQTIAYTESFGPRGGQLNLVDVKSGQTTALGSRLGSSIGLPTWSPNGKIIALTALDPYSSLYREGVNRVLLFLGDGKLQRPQKATEHWSFGGRGNDGPVWSPDGKYMAVMGMGTLWLMPVDKNGDATEYPIRLTEELSDAPSWSADSKQILYMATDRLKIINIEDKITRDLPINLTWTRNQPSDKTIIHVGGLIDGLSNQLQENMDIIIEGHRITEIATHDDSREAETKVDASDAFLMPG